MEKSQILYGLSLSEAGDAHKSGTGMGADGAAEHQKVVQQLAQLGITEAYLLGENFSKTQGVGTRFASTPAFKQWLADNPLSGKTLLIKGSNSMKLTTLVEGLWFIGKAR